MRLESRVVTPLALDLPAPMEAPQDLAAAPRAVSYYCLFDEVLH